MAEWLLRAVHQRSPFADCVITRLRAITSSGLRFIAALRRGSVLVIAFVHRNSIGSAEPAVEIDIGAAAAAERPEFFFGRLSADRAPVLFRSSGVRNHPIDMVAGRWNTKLIARAIGAGSVLAAPDQRRTPCARNQQLACPIISPARARAAPHPGHTRSRRYGTQPAEPDRIALTQEQRRRLVKGEADDIGIGAHDLDYEAPGNPLRRIASGLAAPFSRGKISLDILFGEPLEAHPSFDKALAEGLFRRDQADRSVDAMVAAGQQPQALRRLVEQLSLGQDAPAHRHDRVGGKDERALELVIDADQRERRLGFGARKPVGVGTRQLSALGRLVDVGRTQRVGLNSCLIDQGDPAGRAGGEDEFGPADHHTVDWTRRLPEPLGEAAIETEHCREIAEAGRNNNRVTAPITP
jgi:hypothetical protein